VTTEAVNTASARRLLVDALRLEVARGLGAAVSIDAVCSRAGVTKGALYHYFRDRAALEATAWSEVDAEVAVAMQAALTEWPQAPIAAVCEAFARAAVEPARKRWAEQAAPTNAERAVVPLLREALRAGSALPNPEDAALLLESLLRLWLKAHSTAPISQWLAQLGFLVAEARAEASPGEPRVKAKEKKRKKREKAKDKDGQKRKEKRKKKRQNDPTV
jgi:AcrR family transcriptional regulator